MKHALTLDELVRGGPTTWTASTAKSLAQSLEASGDLGAAHLQSFCIEIENSWKDENASADERRQRWQWINGVVDSFLQGLQPEKLADLASKLPTLDEQIAFIKTLAGRESARSRSLRALEECTTRFGAEVPADQPAAVDEWKRRWLTLIWLHGITGGSSYDAITALLNASPRWLLIVGVESLGKLADYDNVYKKLAAAFVVSTNPDLPNAIASVLTHEPPQRLDEQLELIARASQVREHAARQPDAPPSDAAHELLTRIEMALPSTNAGGMVMQFRNFVRSWRQHDVDQQNLVRAYLDAVPDNHEDVFDFLTRHGTRPRGRVLPDWGGPSVTMWTSGSMRTSSIRHKDPAHRELPSPDFDRQPVFMGISVRSAIQLVREQPDPEFALAYLGCFSRRPDFEQIASEIAADRDHIVCWKAADGVLAAIVWEGVSNLARYSECFKELQETLQPILLPRLPSKYLRNVHLWRLPEALRDDFAKLIEQRLLATHDIRELEDLARAAYDLGLDERDRLPAQIDARRFVLPEASESEQGDSWIWCLARLIRDAPDVAERIVEHIIPSRAGTFVRTQPAFVLGEHEPLLLQHRLALKACLMTRWASSERDEASAALTADLERDFWIFFWTVVYEQPVSVGDRPAPLTPGQRWLDVVDEFGDEYLTGRYIVSLLIYAWSLRERLPHDALAMLGSWVVRWFERHERPTPDEIWTALEQKLEEAARDADVETTATLACLSLPGPPERLRQFRERAVDSVLHARKTAASGRHSGALGKFRTLLTNEAPDLLARLTS